MKKILLSLIVAFTLVSAHAQSVHKIGADSVLITNSSHNAELNIENNTKHIKGFLFNKGNGRTEFRKAVVLNDSTFLFGEDTLVIRGGGSASNLTGANGITRSGDMFKLGGALTEPAVISSASGANNISISGATTGTDLQALLDVYTSKSGMAIRGVSDSGLAIGAISKGAGTALSVRNDGTGRGIQISTNGGNAIEAICSGGTVTSSFGVGPTSFGYNQMHIAPSQSIHRIAAFSKTATTVGNGFGAAIDYILYSNSFIQRDAGRQVWRWTNATDASRTSAIDFYTVNNAELGIKSTIAGNGQWTWHGYPSLAAQADTTSYKPVAIDASGNVVKMNRWPGSGGGGAAIGNDVTGGTSGSILFVNSDGDLAQDNANLQFNANTLIVPNINGRLIPRVGATTSLATITPDAITQDVYKVTALAVNATIAAPTGTFTDGQMIILRIKDNGTSRTLTWNAVYRTGYQMALPASTDAGKTMYLTFIWNSEDSKLDFVGQSSGY